MEGSMELGLKGKNALITAASRGLGRASAMALAGEGARIAVAARNVDGAQAYLEELIAAGAEEAVSVRIDLSKRETLSSGVEEAAQKLGGIDIFVGNTGGPEAAPFLGVTREGWETALDESLLPL